MAGHLNPQLVPLGGETDLFSCILISYHSVIVQHNLPWQLYSSKVTEMICSIMNILVESRSIASILESAKDSCSVAGGHWLCVNGIAITEMSAICDS